MTAVGSQQLVLTVGTTPLPACQAIATVKPSGITLIHGPGSSKLAAERTAQYFRDRLDHRSGGEINLVEVRPFSTSGVVEDLRAALKEKPGLLNGSLVYGPGTTPQNVVTYSEWVVANSDSDHECWYVELSRKSRLTPRFGDSPIDLVPTGLDLNGLVNLHKPDAFSFKAGTVIPTPEDVIAAGVHVTPWLYEGKALHVEARETITNIGIPISNKGSSLEAAVALALLSRYGSDVEVVMNAKFSTEVSNPGNAGTGLNSSAELDVIARRCDRVVVISCGNTKDATSRRLKSLEVRAHAPVIGGSETRTLTVGWARNDDDFGKRRKKAKNIRALLDMDESPSVMTKHVYADASELLGEDPSVTLSRGCSGPGVSQWLLDWLDWSLADSGEAKWE